MNPDPYLVLMDPNTDQEGPKTSDPADPDPQHCCFMLRVRKFYVPFSWLLFFLVAKNDFDTSWLGVKSA